MEKIKVGVIGAGAIAEMAHLPFYSSHPDVELAALADVNRERASSMARQFNVKNIYSSAQEMFEKEQLDAVSICTRNDTHVPFAKLALEHGVHVLVEKPLALTAKEALELEALVQKANKLCMVGMTHRFRNDTRALKKVIDSGDLGDIYYVKARMLQRRNTPSGWFMDKSKSGGGPLMDIGVHVLDLAWWLSGLPEIETVSAHLVHGIGRYDTIVDGRWESADKDEDFQFDVEDFASAFLRFKNGMVMQLEVSWAMNGQADEGIKIDLFGTKAGASLSPLCLYSEQQQTLIDTKMHIKANNPYQEEIHHFVYSIKNNQQTLVDINQGVSVMKMLEAAAKSSMFKKEIIVDDMILAKK
ncbi:Gfo/Idh/MocA family oxidoreductase [Neobacillus sp. PS3-34]|uniref:Gfo/Idh/MocA family protein n=1 Tax=Neobacillus sp. PS3-34 TaxID=3070678 RepID=UPI0027DF6DD9|nr:Gfo/Idh/MocA family oxidoreductase [Neobacillus sp. PS3-34]WML48353.1 Gfo/Idh/MocA family oxidoreductase [Neobacillus sp. PS3-34]